LVAADAARKWGWEYQMRFDLGRFGRGLIIATVISGCIAATGAAMAADTPIDVTIDFAKVMKLSKPAGTIVIGNPGIFDASVGDEKTLVLTGKTAGMTNLIVLDKDGGEIMNAVVRVSSDLHQLTTVFLGAQRQTFSCSPVCELVVSVGDDATTFQNASQQILARKDFSAGQ
jgi:Flp pilus assembly secretin CpaC